MFGLNPQRAQVFDMGFGNFFIQTGKIFAEIPGNPEIGRLEHKHDQNHSGYHQLIEDSVLLRLAQLLEACQALELPVFEQLECGTAGGLHQSRRGFFSHLIE